MKLSMLTVEASKHASISSKVPFRWLAHHVKEILLSRIIKLEIDGSTKIQITCGLGEDGLSQYQQMLGTSDYFVEDFDFSRYFALAGEERDNYLLDIVENSLIDIASRAGAATKVVEAIREAADFVRMHGFSLELRVPKLCKSSPSRQLKAEVFRCLNRSDGEVWRLDVTVKDSLNSIHEWLTKRPHYMDMTDYFKKAEWIGECYILRNRLGKTVYEFKCGEQGPE